MIISTTNDIANYRVVRHLGLVRGITVRSRSVLGNFRRSAIGLRRQALDLRQPCGNGQEALDHMCEHAAQGGANAIVGKRYDANEITDGITEVLAYGTAVWVEPA
jgi:uncharacterized protein YbjQ (UPF0145 family)